ncbi:nuclear transport factor 2 family protein [candidate division WOR-3 bacterium]|nr:nuclear transport factor 2 family protein [candidate division WOR-3 bacterium]
MENIVEEIKEIVNRETRAWDTQDAELLLSVFHPDMVWPWPVKNTDHDPVQWEMILGRFNYERWKKFYDDFFAKYNLMHNKREIKKIVFSDQKDGAFTVVDIDTLWVNKETGEKNHWKGRTCKVYSKVGDEWKMTMHTGVLQY